MKAKILVVTMLTVICITGCNTDTKTVTKDEVTTTKKVVERTTDKTSEATEEVTTEEETTSNIVDGVDKNQYIKRGRFGMPKGCDYKIIESFKGKKICPGDVIHINDYFGELEDRGEAARNLCGALGINVPEEMEAFTDEMGYYVIPYDVDFCIPNTTGKEFVFGQEITEDDYDYIINIYEKK